MCKPADRRSSRFRQRTPWMNVVPVLGAPTWMMTRLRSERLDSDRWASLLTAVSPGLAPSIWARDLWHRLFVGARQLVPPQRELTVQVDTASHQVNEAPTVALVPKSSGTVSGRHYC